MPVTADGVEDYKVEEVWAGPAVYGEQIFTKADGNTPVWISYTQKCYRYDGTLWKDESAFLQTFFAAMIPDKSNAKMNFCARFAQTDMYEGKTNKIYCPSRWLNKMELLENPELEG